jgi:hypothetical protein
MKCIIKFLMTMNNIRNEYNLTRYIEHLQHSKTTQIYM